MATSSGTSTAGIQTILTFPASETFVCLIVLDQDPGIANFLGVLVVDRFFTNPSRFLTYARAPLWNQGVCILGLPSLPSGSFVARAAWRRPGIQWQAVSSGAPF